MSLDEQYRDYFIRNLHDALSGHVSNDIKEAVWYGLCNLFNPFLPRGSPLTNKGFGRSRRDRVNFICSVCTVGGKYFVRLLCIDFTNLSLNLYKTQGN